MKHSILKTLSLGFAAGAIALCTTQVQAQDAPPAPPMMGDMAAPAMMPMPVSGTVLRYYVDRTGFVTAMDVQAADGVKMVRFSPSMASNLTSMYPVGSTASVYVTSSMMGGMTRYDLAGMGAAMPTPGAMMMPMMVSDVDVLKSEPYTTIGAKSMLYTGKVSGAITDPKTGEVLALILDKKTLLRMPRENRQIAASAAPEGITPLMRGAYVAAYGLPEAPRYGSVSPYPEHVIATSVSVNGHPVGPLGFGSIKESKKGVLLPINIPFFGGKLGTDESITSDSGYMPYEASAPMAPDGMTPPPPPAPGM